MGKRKSKDGREFDTVATVKNNSKKIVLTKKASQEILSKKKKEETEKVEALNFFKE